MFIVKNALISITRNKGRNILIGAINNSNEGTVSLTIDSSSSITLTGDTYLKSFTNSDSSNSNINTNEYKIYVDGVLYLG